MSSTSSHVDSTSNDARSITDDSLDASLKQILPANQQDSESSASEILAELFLNRRRLREAETQVCSLSLILQNSSSSCGVGSGIDHAVFRDNKSSLEDGCGVGSGIDHAVFRDNKSSLEDELVKFRREICEKELLLKQRDSNLYANYLCSFENDSKEESCGVDGTTQCDEDVSLDTIVHELAKQTSGGQEFTDKNGIDEVVYSPKTAELFSISDLGFEEREFTDDQQYFESSPDEITKLRRTLSETRRKYKEERYGIMKQLKALQVTTVNGETNWRCVLKEKEIEIEELTRKNVELQTRNKELNFALKNIENLRHKETKEKEKRVKKNAKVIASLRNQILSSDEKNKILLNEVEKARNINLNERNKKLEKCLGEKDEVIQGLSEEIQDTNSLVNKLIIEVNCVNSDKENLIKQIEKLEAENAGGLEDVDGIKLSSHSVVHLGIQTEESSSPLQDELYKLQAELASERKEKSSLFHQVHEQKEYVECLRQNEVRLQNESEKWKSKSFENERIIQELTISLGKAMTANKSSSKRNFDKYGEMRSENRRNTPHYQMVEDLRSELSSLQEDLFKNKENVDSLQKTWRKYEAERKTEQQSTRTMT